MVTIHPQGYPESTITIDTGGAPTEVRITLRKERASVSFSLDTTEAEAVENALRIQRREAERRRK